MQPIILDATTKSIEAVLSGAVATTQPSFTAGWADDTSTTFVEGASDGALNSTTPVTLVAAPAASTRRVIRYITISNKDTAPVTVTISYNNNSTLRQIAKVTLAVNDTWTSTGTFDASGNFKTATTTAIGGSNTQVQYNNNGVLGGITGATSNGTALTLTSGRATTDFSPTTNDGATLGTTSLQFSDLYLASGGVVNFANGNVTLTQSSGILTQNAGEFRITSANVGTNADSVPTLSSTSTLTNKTLTSPTIQTLPVYATGTNLVLTVPTADDTATGEITNAFNSGYSSTAIGDLVYLDSSSTWQKADADLSAAAYSGFLGIALEVKASGNAVKVLLRGFAYCSTAFPTFTVGGIVYMSATAGAVTQTAPTTTDSATRILGYAVHADKMWFNPSNDWITHV